jgi:hypothetical protein
MAKQKFNPELASEMEWSECILAASIVSKDKERTAWECSGCNVALIIVNHENLTDTAQEFLDRGWRYRRTRVGLDAVCPSCKNSHSHK